MALAMSVISDDEVRRIAALAHLALTDDEIAKMGRELGAILTYVKQLEDVDVEGVAAMAHVTLAAMPLRDDVVAPSLSRDEALSQSARVTEDGFAVPSFVDEG